MQANVHVHTHARAHTAPACVACVRETPACQTPLAPTLAHLAVVLVRKLFINHVVAVLEVDFLFLRAFVCVLA